MVPVEDRFGRSKWAFWGFAALLAALAAAPSAFLLRAAQSYYRFLTGAAPATVRPIRVDFLDHSSRSQPVRDENLQFVEFRLRAPKAKAVELIGDFNGWKAGTLPLASAGGGSWEIMLPLSPGRYHYLYVVDGQAQTDPRAPAEAGADGKQTSVRPVP